MKIVHLVNVLTPRDGSDLCLAQPVTIESLKRARQSAGTHNVRIASAQFPEDRNQVPDWMETTEDLQDSSLTHPEFTDSRKLPNLHEIWSRLLACSEENDLLIYTNIDIAVRPDFYSKIAEFMDQGWESISITRRTIPNKYTHASQLPEMYNENGVPHPGDDCFVIRRECASRLRILPVFTGAGWFDKILLINLAWKTNFKKFRDEHLTFHIGDDRTWLNPRAKTVADWNKKQMRDLIMEMERERGKAYRDPKIWPHVQTVYKHAGFNTPFTYNAFRQLRTLACRLRHMSHYTAEEHA